MKKTIPLMSALLLCLQAPAAILFQDDMPSGAATLPAGNWDGLNHSANTGTAAHRNNTTVVAEANDPGSNGFRLFLGMPGGSYAPGTREAMLFTPTAAFNTAVTENQSLAAWDPASWTISYWMRNDNGPTTRLALNVSGQWYVRNAASTLVTTDVNNWQNFSVTNPFGSAGWTPIGFTAGTSLDRITLTGTNVLPTTGTLDGIGVWASSGSNYGLRLDLVTIEATVIPEPGTLALVGVFGVVATALLRRRKA